MLGEKGGMVMQFVVNAIGISAMMLLLYYVVILLRGDQA